MNEIIIYVVVGLMFGSVFAILILEWIKQLKWEFYDD